MKRVLPIIIVILLIIGVGGGVVWSILAGRYKPTEEVIDYAAEMGLSENEYAITLNQEVLKEDRAVAIDGTDRSDEGDTGSAQLYSEDLGWQQRC